MSSEAAGSGGTGEAPLEAAPGPAAHFDPESLTEALSIARQCAELKKQKEVEMVEMVEIQFNFFHASFHANVYFPIVSFLFRFEYLLVLLEAGFFKSKSSCRNPDSNSHVLFVHPGHRLWEVLSSDSILNDSTWEEALKLRHLLSLAAKPDFMPPACFQQAWKLKLHTSLDCHCCPH